MRDEAMVKPEPHRPNIMTDGGPWAMHDMACPVYHEFDRAVLNLSTGVFEPGKFAQRCGWRTVKADTKWKQFILWLGGMNDDNNPRDPYWDIKNEYLRNSH